MIKKYLNMLKYLITKVMDEKFEIFYSIYFTMLFVDTTSLVYDYPSIGVIARIMRYIFYVLFLIRIFMKLPEYWNDISRNKWKSKSKTEKFIIIVLILLFISVVINFITIHNNRMILLLLALLAAYKTDYKKLIKCTMIMQIALTSIVTLTSMLGITQNYAVIRNETKMRYSLGFTYPTNLSQMILFSSLLYLYIKKFEVKWTSIFVIQLLNNLMFFITDSKAEFIVLELIILISVLYKLNIINKLKKYCKKALKFFAYTFPIYIIMSLLLVLLYPQGGIFEKINSILSSRLKYQYEVLNENGLRLFGDDIEFIGFGLKDYIKYGNVESNFVDNEYLQMLFNEGICISILFIIILNILLIMLYKQKKSYDLFLCGVYLLFGIINPRIIILIYCPILFMIIPTFTQYFKEHNKTEVIK